MKILPLLLALNLVGCAVTPLTEEEIGAKPDEKVVEYTLKAWLDRNLKDPESAKIMIGKPQLDRYRGWVVCALVNAKNNYGGYIGYEGYRMTYRGNLLDSIYPLHYNGC